MTPIFLDSAARRLFGCPRADGVDHRTAGRAATNGREGLRKRDLPARRCVYVRADSIHLQPRLEVIGHASLADPDESQQIMEFAKPELRQ
jgi:hypothetical protein